MERFTDGGIFGHMNFSGDLGAPKKSPKKPEGN